MALSLRLSVSRLLEVAFYTVIVTLLVVPIIDLYYKGQANQRRTKECQLYGYSTYTDGMCSKEVLGAKRSQRLSYLRRRFS